MATIVKLKDSEAHAVLIGTGFGQFKSARPNMFFGDLLPSEKSGHSCMAAVSTAEGEILWCSSDDLIVVSIDGESPTEALLPYFR